MLIRVAVAVIINKADEVFICRRSAEQHQGNKWEFPGGKIEANESAYDALVREIDEECGITIQSAIPLTTIKHQYDIDNPAKAKTVSLEVFEVRDWQGEPKGMEGQPTCWIARNDLVDYEFPKANKAILQKLLK